MTNFKKKTIQKKNTIIIKLFVITPFVITINQKKKL